MRIDFESAGGYGGLFTAQPLSYKVDTEDLPQNLRDKLDGLIAASGLLELESVPEAPAPGQARDTFTYKLSLRDRTTAKTFAFDDISAPPAARPLLNYLRELALQARKA